MKLVNIVIKKKKKEIKGYYYLFLNIWEFRKKFYFTLFKMAFQPTEKNLARMKSLLNVGTNFTIIARELGCCLKTVRRWSTKFQLKEEEEDEDFVAEDKRRCK